MPMDSVSAPIDGRNAAAFAVNNAALPSDLINLHLQHPPAAVPQTHTNRGVTIATPHDHSLCVRGPSYEVQKTFRLANPTHHPVHPRGTWDDACDPTAGKWEELSRISFGAHASHEVWLDELRDWAELLDGLAAQPDAGLILGRLKHDARRDASRGRWLVSDRQGRYDDVPSRWLLVDLDHMPGEPEAASGVLPDYISDTMPELSACAYVAAFTSSAGIKGARVRLVFELAAPRTLAAMRSFAQMVNTRAGVEIIDSSLYTPGHLVITTAPRLFASVAQGNIVTAQQLPRPVRDAAWFVAGDLASIPDAAVTFVTGDAAYVPKGQRSESMTKAAAAELLQALGPGSYSVNVHRWLCHVAWTAPAHRGDAAFNEAVSIIQDRIRETSEPARLGERLRIHGNECSLRRAWDSALERKAQQLTKRVIIGAAPAPVVASSPVSLSALGVNTAHAIDLSAAHAVSTAQAVPPPTIDNVRAQLKADFKAEATAITRGAKRHVLFKHAPGAGKTTALLEVLNAGHISSNLTRIAVPTHALAEQLVADIKAHARGIGDQGGGMHYDTDLVASVRHHKGRGQPGMCPDPVSKPKADLAESFGVPVKRHVCSGCATEKAGNCPWLAQADDDGNGVIVEAHHAANSPVERRADLVINDEGTIGAAIQTGGDSVPIADLANTATIYAVREGYALGARLGRATLDLSTYRTELRLAVGASIPKKEGEAGKLLTCAIPSLVADVTFEARRGMRTETRTGTGAAHAIELEARLQATLFARIANDKTPDANRKDAVASLRTSQAATLLYQAIDASARRSYVFGVAAYFQGSGKSRVNRVKCVRRAPRPAAESSISFDGTADVDVWRALVATTGAPFEQQVYDATPIIPAGAVTVHHYADKAGALASLLSPPKPTTAEAAANELRTQLLELSSRPWAVAAYGDLPTRLADAETLVAAGRAESDRKRRNADTTLKMLWRFVLTEAVSHISRAVPVAGEQVSTLLIAQKAVIERLRGMGLPSTVVAVHFGALRGLNDFKDVPCCIVIGRPRPSDIDLELMTEALHSHNPAVTEIARRVSGWTEEHPDARVAAVQRVTAAAEVKQAVARMRPYDRTVANSCTVHVFGAYDCGLPPELVQLRAWSDADRSPVEVALAYGAVFSDARLNQQSYGGLFPKADASGRGLVGLEQRRKFTLLVRNMRRQFEVEKKLGAYPYKERRDGVNEFPIRRKHRVSDALSFAADGADSVPGRTHKLVRLRTDATRGPATLALVNADWTQARAEQLLRCPITHWHEMGADEVLAIGGRRRPRLAVREYCRHMSAVPG
ncbi:hypothetical protein [Hyphomicrobium sp.]|uniref:hypothetical protein n=1 Tax=Hyphomicrobium sp. TaxID=82 RepID=UPI0025B7F474|nr:hypothetical protein [Hyphomicrobium sp.]MCC7251612.1 hypothetical protein [Hyphomicrobium sp.]